MRTKYRFHTDLYTDTITKSRTGFSVLVEGNVIRKRTHNYSIYSVKSIAVIKSLKWISNQDRVGAFIICSDSLSVITTIEKRKIKSSLKDEITMLHNDIIAPSAFLDIKKLILEPNEPSNLT